MARRHRLHRPQRPQLPALRGAARRARRRAPADEHELLGQRRGRGLRVLGRLAGGLFAQRAHLVTPRFAGWWPTTCASTARRARCSRRAATALAAAPSSTTRRFSRWFVERLLVPQAVGRVVGRPASRCGRSRRASWSSSSTTTACSGSPGARSGATIGAARARYVEALTAPFARPHAASRTPVAAITRHPTHVDVDAARRRARGVRRGRARRALRPGAGAARRPERARAEILGAIPYQPNEAVLHTDRACCRAAARAWASWNYHLLAEPTGRDDGHLPHEPPAVARRRPRVLRDAEPHGRDRAGARDPRRSRTRTRSSRAEGDAARRRRHARDQRRQPHALRGAYWGWGFHEDGVVSALRGRASAAAARLRCSALYEGTIRHRRFACAEHAFRYRDRAGLLDLDELPSRRRPLWSTRSRRSCASAAATTSATPPCRWPTPCARWSTSASARARRADPAADAPALRSGTASTR